MPATYATKTYVRDYVNDSGFITSIPSSYITETELENELAAKGYASEDYVIRKIGEAQLGGGEPGDPSELLKNYATIAQLNTKADSNHSHSQYLTQSALDDYATKKYVDDAIEGIENGGITINPPDMSNYPTLDVMNEALAGKAEVSHSHTSTEIEGLDSLLESKADKDDIYDKEELTGKLNELTTSLGSKSDVGHNHDNEYYTPKYVVDFFYPDGFDYDPATCEGKAKYITKSGHCPLFMIYSV